MKLKKIIAAVLCMVQLLCTTVILAEEEIPLESSEAEIQIEETVSETEIPAAENELRVFVSPDGSDSNSGTFDNPVLTIEKGIALGTQLKNSNEGKTVSVNIRGGDYYVNKTIQLTSQNSGTEQNPFIIQAYNGETVNIKGSTPLTPTRFTQLKDSEVLAKIPEEARKYIGVYDLSRNVSNLTPYTGNNSSLGYTCLIVDDKEQTLARWPNTGFDRTSVVNGERSFTGTDGKSRSSNWKLASNAMACGYFGVEYFYEEVPITSIDSNVVVLSEKPYYGIADNKRYYVKNLIEELDSPGEYYIDTKTGKLYYYPPYPISKVSMEIATMNVPMFSGTGLSNIIFKGIGIKNTRSSGIEFTSSYNITIDGCEMKNVGIKGIVMDECTNCKIINNTICQVGSSAIDISGGDRQKLVSSNNLIDNNHIYDFASTFRTNNPGINLNGVGTTITHNLIHGSPSQGILFSGNDHKMLYNEFYDLVNEPCDAGAIYAGRNYTCRGNEIAYNYFHDIDTSADKGGSIFVAGVYLDDMFSSADVHHNVFYKCNLGVMIGGGRDNNFDNNILLDCDNGMFMDARGVGWANYHTVPGGQAYNTILQVPYTKSPWSERYPELVNILDTTVGLPMNNSIQNNIMYRCMSNLIANEMKDYGTVQNNYETKEDNSFFVDYVNRNFALKSDSKMAADFPEAAKINMSDMGLLPEKAESEKENAEEHPFRLISPYNGQTDVSNLSYTFQWEKHSSASKYILNIAEDPEMKNVILTQETKNTIADVQFIPSGGKALWWTVTGVNESQSMGGVYNQLGAPKLIISTLREKTDKKELRENINVLNSLYNSAMEGTTPGTYKKGFKDTVKEILDEATNANEAGDILQKDIETINDKYDSLIASIKDYINYDVVNIGDLLENKGGWVYEDGYYTFNDDGSLSLTGSKGKTSYYTNCIYDEPLGENVAIKFGYKVNVSSNYCLFGLQNDATFLSGGYDIIIKSNAIEIQRHLGSNTDGIKESVLNFYVSDDKWVDLELGALKTGVGTYVYLMADGYLVADFLDMDQPYWTGESKFVFNNPSGNMAECVASIRPAQE